MELKKVLIIPDVHGRDFWKEPCREDKIGKYDKIIFLGDYVDPYEDEGLHSKDGVSMLKEIIDFKKAHEDKVVLLLGNHDLHYIYDDIEKSSRYDGIFANEIRLIFNENMDLFQLAFECEFGGKRHLFTHAGIMASWYERHKERIGELTADNLNKLLETRESRIPLNDVSPYRMFFPMYSSGSIIWSDVQERFRKRDNGEIDGIMQTFGHTRMRKGGFIDQKNWACLDCQEAFSFTKSGRWKIVK